MTKCDYNELAKIRRAKSREFSRLFDNLQMRYDRDISRGESLLSTLKSLDRSFDFEKSRVSNEWSDGNRSTVFIETSNGDYKIEVLECRDIIGRQSFLVILSSSCVKG